jgi:flagellum-specific ATP synthase
MPAVAAREHVEAARRIRQMLARLSKARDLIQLGAYTPGHDHDLDIAVRSQAQLRGLLQQDTWQRATLVDSIAQLHQVSRGAA